jgi:hypothetical protein
MPPEDTTPPDVNAPPQGNPAPPGAAPPAVPPSQPAGTAQPPLVAPEPPSIPALEPNADLERVTRLYHNVVGQLTAYVASAEGFRGQLEQRLRTADTSARLNYARAQEIEGARTALEGQLADVPSLQERAEQGDQASAQLARLQYLTQFPQIIGAVQVEEVTAEDGTVSEARTNPTLDLLMSSSLDGEQFDQHVRAFVQNLPTFGNAPGAPPPSAGSTRPPPPASRSSADDLMSRANEAMQAGDYREAERLLDEYQTAVHTRPG